LAKELTPLALARLAGLSALSKKGFDVKILGVTDLTSVCDYFVIASGDADVQVRAIAKEVEKQLREAGYKPYHREGETRGNWILLDYLDVVVHIFYEPTRRFYALEKLWGDATIEELSDEVAAAVNDK
jgi:ribosome-associated protein